MALTRKFLKGMGLTDEQVDAIIDAHSETVNGLKTDIERYKGDSDKLAGVQKELDGLKAAGDGGYKEKYEKEHKAFEDYKKEQSAKETRGAKEAAYRGLLKKIGVGENRLDKVLKLCDVDAVELDDKGEIKGADKLSESLKTEWEDFIVTTETHGAKVANPPTGAGTGGQTMTKNDILNIKDAGERQAAIAAHPDLFGLS